MTTRSIECILLGDTWSAVTGHFQNVPLPGGGGSMLHSPWYEFHRADAELDPGESSVLADLRTMLNAKLVAQEPVVGLRDWLHFRLYLSNSGFVDGVYAEVRVTVAGETRYVKGWERSRETFSVEERADLDAAVPMLVAHLEAAEPL